MKTYVYSFKSESGDNAVVVNASPLSAVDLIEEGFTVYGGWADPEAMEERKEEIDRFTKEYTPYRDTGGVDGVFEYELTVSGN